MSCRPWLIIPVKSLTTAKSSFADRFSPDERKMLVIAMLSDVLAAASRSKVLRKVCVLSSDREILSLAEEMGTLPLEEPGLGLNPALEFAADFAMRAGADSVLIMPSDVPLVTPEDIDGIVSMADAERVVVISPSKDRGTNALLLRPPDVIHPKFGGESFPAHMQEAMRAGVGLRIYHSENLAHDIDRPADLLKVRVLAPASRTSEFLSQLEGMLQK